MVTGIRFNVCTGDCCYCQFEYGFVRSFDIEGVVVLACVELCVKWDLNFFHFCSIDSEIGRVGRLRGFGGVEGKMAVGWG